MADESLAYLEWSAEPGADLDDRDVWAQANPALGYRITEETIHRERLTLPDEDFGRERLGLWADLGAGVINEQAWAAAADLKSQPVDPVAFSVDVTPDRSMTAIGVAGARSDGLLHVEVVEHHRGTSWVVPRVLELRQRWWPAAIVIDGSGPGGSLITEFKDESVEVTVPAAREYGQACGQFFDAVMDSKALRHINQPELNDAVASAVQRTLGDAWAWSRRNTLTDISPLVAVTLALWGYMQHARQGNPNAWWV